MRVFSVLLFSMFVFVLFVPPVNAQQTVAAKNRYKIAKNLFTAGSYEKAENELTEALRLDGHYGDALYLMALTKFQLKKNEESIKIFKQLIAEQPKFYSARLFLSTVYMKMGELDKAEEQVDYYITNDSADPWGHYAKGVIYYTKGDLANSIQAWDKSISLDKDHVSSYYNKGIALFWSGKTDEALKVLKKALEMKSNNSNLYRFSIGHLNYLSGSKEEALKEFKYLAELIPTMPIGLVSAGFVLFEEGKYEDALAKADEALKLDENFSAALELKSYALEKQKSYDAALELCERLLKNDKNDTNASKRIEQLKKLKENPPSDEEKSPEKQSTNQEDPNPEQTAPESDGADADKSDKADDPELDTTGTDIR